MAINIGINGLGRIGRCILRYAALNPREDINIVAVNAPAPTERHIHLLQYDSVHGTFPGEITGDGTSLSLNGKSVALFKEREPEKIPWGDAGVDIVLECTGVFKKRADAERHCAGGAKKVIISAPSPDAEATIVYGVNNDVLTAEQRIISIGSCTTNCLAPVAKTLDAFCGIRSGFMTTIHSYTNDQNVLDGTHKDLRRARASAMSMIPTSTGAASAIGKVLPQLEGKLDGVSVRVPTPNVSLVDFVFHPEKPTTADAIHDAIAQAAQGELKDVMDITHAPLVSIDFNGNTHSAVFDATQTHVVGEDIIRVAAWYDNEWGFSVRMLDVAALMR